MNHRRSPGGYHSPLPLGVLAAVLFSGCAPANVAAPRPSPPSAVPGPSWQAARLAVVTQINAARAGFGLPALVYDARLELVGDAHCAKLIAEGGDGHFSRDGVPPYLRWLLAGGHGYHMENVSAYSTTGTVAATAVGGILSRSVAAMLAEVPPDDGHRRALLDRSITHIGVGLAIGDGELRMTHELATEVTTEWTAPREVAPPRTGVALSGRLAEGWQPEALEVLWEELPHPFAEAQLRAMRSYAYPPRRAMLDPNRSAAGQAPAFPGAVEQGEATVPFAVDQRSGFTYRWSTGPHDGVEILVLWARHRRDPEYVPVAVSATVVARSGTLPAQLAFWHQLGSSFDRASGGPW